MNPGLFSGTTKTSWHEFFPKLLVANSDGTGLTQPINNGTPLRNLGRYTYLDPNTIFGEVHMSHSYFHPTLGGNEGTGAFYVIELPTKAKRWGGKSDETAPYIIGGGYGNKVLQTPNPEMMGVATLADPSLFNIKGESEKYMQVFFPYKQQVLSGTWPANTQTRAFSHFMSYAPNAEDIDFHFTSTTTGQFNNPLIITSTTTSVFNIQFAFGNAYYSQAPGMVSTALTVTAARYNACNSTVAAWGTSTTGAAASMLVPIACTVDSLYVSQDTAIGAGSTRTWVVRKDPSTGTFSDTTLTCTIAGASQTTNNDTTHSFTCNAGDRIQIGTSADAATSTGVMRWTVRLMATTNSSFISGGSSGSLSNAATQYIPVDGFYQSITSTDVEMVMPNDGTIKNMYAQVSASPGVGTSYAFTLVKNGSDTGLTCTISDSNTTANDLTAGHAVSYVQGDRLYWKQVPTGTPTARAAWVAAEVNPTNPGETVHATASSNNMISSAQRFDSISHPASNARGTTDASRTVLSQSGTWKKITGFLNASPGTGKSWNIQLVKNGSAGNPQITISNAATSGSDNTNTIDTAAGDTISISTTPSGTPTATAGTIGVVSYLPSTGLPTSTLNYEYKIKAEPRSDTLGSWAYSPSGPWAWSLVQGHYVQFIYEIDN